MTRTVTSKAPGSGTSISSSWNASSGSPWRSSRITHAAMVGGSSPGSTSSCATCFVSIATAAPDSGGRMVPAAAGGFPFRGRRARCARPHHDTELTPRPTAGRAPGLAIRPARLVGVLLAGMFAGAQPADALESPRRLAPPRPSAEAPPVESHPTRLLVRFRGPGGDSAARAVGGRVGERVGRTGFRVVSVWRTGRRAALLRLRADRRVAAAEPDYVRRAAAEPSDPFWAKSGAQQPLRVLRAPAGWDIQHAAGAVIAVVDSGVDLDHPDLADRLLPGRDYVGGDLDPRDDTIGDARGHGTQVAGIAAAATDNARGIAGVAWGARILPVKVLDRFGSGYDSDVAAGMTWAADQGADVINLSLGGAADSAVLRDAVAYAGGRGSTVVAAAGNDGGRATSYPAAIPSVIAVSAGTRTGEPAYFSNHGSWVDLSAPGVEVLTTDLAAGPAEAYAFASGTSFAAPHVAGAAALLSAQHPDWSAAQIADRLQAAAQDLGPPGVDPYHGAGRLDVAAALGAPNAPPSAPPPGDRFEPDDVPDRAATLEVGEGREARLAPEGDVDWVGLPVDRPGWVLVKVVPIDGELSLPIGIDATLEAYDPSTRKLAERDGGGPGDEEWVEFHADAPGRYLVRVRNHLGTPVPYRLEAHAIQPLVHDADFAAYAQYATPSPPKAAAVADVTGDGRNDVLVTTGSDEGHEGDGRLWIYRQTSDGWLAPPEFQPAHGWAVDVTAGDVDGDGDRDAAVALSGEGIDVHRQAAGRLGDPEFVPLAGAERIVAADLDRDGRSDLVVTRPGVGITALMSRPGGWQARTVASSWPSEVEVGDLTGDGRPDIAAGLTVHAQQADGSFAAGLRSPAAGAGPRGGEMAPAPRGRPG